MRFTEKYKAVPILLSADINAGVDSDSINMKGFHRACFLLTFGTLVGDAVLTLYSGATNGAKTTALTFHYAIGGATLGSADCDVLAADTEAATLTLTAATYGNKMLAVEIEAQKMDMANEHNWLTLSLNSDANSGAAAGYAILTPRYTGNRSASALV